MPLAALKISVRVLYSTGSSNREPVEGAEKGGDM